MVLSWKSSCVNEISCSGDKGFNIKMDVWSKCVQHNIPIDQRSGSHLKLLKV